MISSISYSTIIPLIYDNSFEKVFFVKLAKFRAHAQNYATNRKSNQFDYSNDDKIYRIL